MEVCETLAERRNQADALASLLGFQIPVSYYNFLIESGSEQIYGLPILGLPIGLQIESSWGATEFLRFQRPDLPPTYLVIRFMDSRALCLDTTQGTAEDSPLVEIDFTKTDDPKLVHPSFKQYLIDGRNAELRINKALVQIKRYLDENKQNDYNLSHVSESKLPKAHHFRLFRSCVHDQVVALTVFKYNEEKNGIEVDVFLSTDHPNYEKGHGVRAALLLILSDAYRNGSTMNIYFTFYDPTTGKRVPYQIPPEVLSLGSELNVDFSEKKNGIIQHNEAIELYSHILGFSDIVKKTALRFQKMGNFTLQGLCYLISAHIWNIEEVSWIIQNFYRPEKILFGEALPEDRLNYLESLSYGRAALLMTKFTERIKNTEKDSDCFVEVRHYSQIINPAKPVRIDWGISDKEHNFSENDIIEVFSFPRILLNNEVARIQNDISFILERSQKNAKKILLYSEDFKRMKNINELLSKIEEKNGINILIAPFSCHELDKELENRMRRARVLRK